MTQTEEQPDAAPPVTKQHAGRIPRGVAQLIACVIAILPMLACAILLTLLAG